MALEVLAETENFVKGGIGELYGISGVSTRYFVGLFRTIFGVFFLILWLVFLLLLVIDMVFVFELLYELCLYLFSVGVEYLLVEEFPEDGLEVHFLGNSLRRSVSWM